MSPFGPQTTAEEITSTFPSHITNHTFFITGTSAGGLGAQIATTLAQHAPAHLLLVARSKLKVDSIITQISFINPVIKTTFIPCELTPQPSVRAAANAILTSPSIPPIDVLILNAGIMAVPTYQTDDAGILYVGLVVKDRSQLIPSVMIC